MERRFSGAYDLAVLLVAARSILGWADSRVEG
jgi:hypothetical protein